MRKKVLIVAAHPDDDILGCGGMLSKYKKIYDFKVLFIGEGSSCRFDDLDKRKDVIEKTIEIRNNYAMNALQIFGVTNTAFHNLPCGRLDTIPIIQINKIIESAIVDFQPDALLTHSEFDANNDHRIVYRASIMAARPGVFKNLKTLMSFEVLSSSEWNFSETFLPNHYESLTLKDLNYKWRALRCFESEIRKYPHPRSEEGLKTLAMFRGMQSGQKYAEAYKVIRNFE